jgi:hypothetical protein
MMRDATVGSLLAVTVATLRLQQTTNQCGKIGKLAGTVNRPWKPCRAWIAASLPWQIAASSAESASIVTLNVAVCMSVLLNDTVPSVVAQWSTVAAFWLDGAVISILPLLINANKQSWLFTAIVVFINLAPSNSDSNTMSSPARIDCQPLSITMNQFR